MNYAFHLLRVDQEIELDSIKINAMHELLHASGVDLELTH